MADDENIQRLRLPPEVEARLNAVQAIRTGMDGIELTYDDEMDRRDLLDMPEDEIQRSQQVAEEMRRIANRLELEAAAVMHTLRIDEGKRKRGKQKSSKR